MDKGARFVLKTLLDNGYDARIAGGAVRDIILHLAPKDWDIATTALPEQVMALFPHTIPTGIDHGTITVIIDGDSYEVTTLRKDVTTDGRRAVVEFTDNWYEDSLRRDFTFNAMYLDIDGNLYDYHGGKNNLENKDIRFVGDAETRIREDYLRILRFFRFVARFNCEVNDEHYSVIFKTMEGLKNISVERIWSEMKKIHKELSYNSAIFHMNKIGVSETIGITDGFITTYENIFCPCDTRMYYSIFSKNRNTHLFSDWKMSVDEMKTFRAFNQIEDASIEELIYESTNNPYIKKCVKHLEHFDTKNDKIKQLNEFFVKYPEIVFPFSGHDLMQEGYKGKELGDVLFKRKTEHIKTLLTDLNT